jgi:hypothetical protein
VPHDSDGWWQVTSVNANRLDIIANMFYGTPQLWWILAAVNDLVDPMIGFVPGQFIRIPTKDRLAAEGILNV